MMWTRYASRRTRVWLSIGVLCCALTLLIISHQTHDQTRQQIAAVHDTASGNNPTADTTPTTAATLLGDWLLEQSTQTPALFHPPQRLDVIEALERLHHSHELSKITYSIDAQRRLERIPSTRGMIEVVASAIHLDVALLHENDALKLLKDLHHAQLGLIAEQSCVLQRRPITASLPQSDSQPNSSTAAVYQASPNQRPTGLQLQCVIDLVSLLQPSHTP